MSDDILRFVGAVVLGWVLLVGIWLALFLLAVEVERVIERRRLR